MCHNYATYFCFFFLVLLSFISVCYWCCTKTWSTPFAETFSVMRHTCNYSMLNIIWKVIVLIRFILIYSISLYMFYTLAHYLIDEFHLLIEHYRTVLTMDHINYYHINTWLMDDLKYKMILIILQDFR